MKIFLDKNQIEDLKERPWFRWVRTYRYSLLFVAILAQFMLLPFLEDKMRVLVPVMFLLIVFTVLFTLDLRRVVFQACLAFGLLATGVQIMGRALQVSPTEELYFFVFALSLEILFLLFVIYVLVIKIFSEEKVSGETIKGGISVYFLLGYLWAYLYSVILILSPEAISFSMQKGELSKIIYFSFTTLTTLGYGDITPVAWIARNLTILESAIGQIFLTVLIARLVGLHLVQKSQPVCAGGEEK